MTDVHVLGTVRIRVLTDAAGEFFRPVAEVFPEAPDSAWRGARERDPEAFADDGRWRLRFRCFLVTAGARTILVDAGVGRADAPAASWAPAPGRLPDELAAVGLASENVDVVVLSHLHTDHVGWAVAPTYFPNAVHVLQQTEHDAVGELNPDLGRTLIDPLRAAGQLRLVDGSASLAAGVRVAHAPGHTPGHQVVIVEHSGDTVAITGDAFVHAIQLVDPAVAYVYESDPEQARDTRHDLLREATVLATAHLTEPFVTIGAM